MTKKLNQFRILSSSSFKIKHRVTLGHTAMASMNNIWKRRTYRRRGQERTSCFDIQNRHQYEHKRVERSSA